MTTSYGVSSESLNTMSTGMFRRHSARYQRRTVSTYCLSRIGPTALSSAHQLSQSNRTATRDGDVWAYPLELGTDGGYLAKHPCGGIAAGLDDGAVEHLGAATASPPLEV